MKSDIKNRSDIETLIQRFYDKAKVDPDIGFYFKGVDWKNHLPKMHDFWENALFCSGGYSGNPLNVHRNLNSRSPFLPGHFERWTSLFMETVDELFEGPISERAKQHALSISTVMKIKIMGQAPDKNRH